MGSLSMTAICFAELPSVTDGIELTLQSLFIVQWSIECYVILMLIVDWSWGCNHHHHHDHHITRQPAPTPPTTPPPPTQIQIQNSIFLFIFHTDWVSLLKRLTHHSLGSRITHTNHTVKFIHNRTWQTHNLKSVIRAHTILNMYQDDNDNILTIEIISNNATFTTNYINITITS